jgi:hypothetical protein
MIFNHRSATRLIAIGILGAAVALLATASKADTLTLTNVGNGTVVAGDYVGPYGITVVSQPKSSGTLEDLFCLDLNREITVGETWQAQRSTLSIFSSTADKAAALIIGAEETGQLSQGEAQLYIWFLTDTGNDGLTQSEINTVDSYEHEASLNLGGNQYYNQFTLETAIPNTQTGSDGTAQDFLGDFSGTPRNVPVAPTPEPSSLVLFGTGLVAAATTLRRRIFNR